MIAATASPNATGSLLMFLPSIPHPLATKAHTIMAHDCSITQALLTRQKSMFGKAAEAGYSHKVLHADTGLSLSIIGQYARGETAMSGPSILKMRRVVGPSLISILFDDGDYLIPGAGEMDYDTLASGCIAYAATHAQARHPASPGGVEIVDCERSELDGKVAYLPIAGKLAA